MAMNDIKHDLGRTTLAVLFIMGLLAISFWILRPFMLALIWATMIVVPTWPLMRGAQERLGQRRWLAVTVMTIAMLLVFIIPFSLAVGTIVAKGDQIADWTQSLGSVSLPDPPDWVEKLPLVGRKLDSDWRELAATGPEGLRQRIAPHARDMARRLVASLGSLGMLTVHFLLTVVVAAILYAHGETAVAGVSRFFRRLGGQRGERLVHIAGQAIRAVALGVVVTAIVQTILGGIGLTVAGVPFAGILTALIFILSVAQIGPAPVLICAVIWLYSIGDNGWATGLLVWGIFVSAIDNVLRPFLIKRHADLPLFLIFAGVIGGLVSFGVIGIFVGPMVLAVTYRLIEAWVREGEA
jgi:predicted PurR-regulated permease PerM